MRLLRVVVLLVLLSPATALAATAPGAPGQTESWNEADKDGFGTAATKRSKVWHTLDDGALTEVFYPDLGTPAVRDLQFAVSDGRSFAERERENAGHRIELTDRRSLSYRQVNATRRWRITKTYSTDPARNALVVDVRFKSLTGRKLALYSLFDPQLSNGGDDDSGSTAAPRARHPGRQGRQRARRLPGFKRTSNGYFGTSDGWTDLKSDFRMDWAYRRRPTATCSRPPGPSSTASGGSGCGS